MVVVLADHLAGDRVAGGGGLVGVGVAVLRPHQQAQLVGEVVLERRVGIMGEPHAVDAQVPERGEVLPQLVVGDRHGVVLGLLVLAHPAQRDRRAVEQEAPAHEPEVAEAGALLHHVHDAPLEGQLGPHAVEMGSGGAPQPRLLDPRRQLDRERRTAVHVDRPDQRDHLPGLGVQQPAPQLRPQAGRTGVADEHLHRQVGRLGGDVAGSHVHARRRVLGGIDVEGMGGEQPDLSVEPAVEVVELLAEPGRQRVGGVGGIVGEAHGEHVVAHHRGGSRREDEAREGAPVLAEVGAVEVDVGEDGRALEIEVERPARFVVRQREVGAVPGAAQRPLAPGVRHADRLPVVVVEGRRLSARQLVAGLEAPRPGQQEPRPLALRGRRGPGRRRTRLAAATGPGREREEEASGEPTPGRPGHRGASSPARPLPRAARRSCSAREPACRGGPGGGRRRRR